MKFVCKTENGVKISKNKLIVLNFLELKAFNVHFSFQLKVCKQKQTQRVIFTFSN